MLRRIAVLSITCAGLFASSALAGPTPNPDPWHAALPILPQTRPMSTCAQAQMQTQRLWMVARGWPIEDAELRTFTQGLWGGDTDLLDDPDIPTTVQGATFRWDGRWVIIMSPRIEAELCHAYTRMHRRQQVEYEDGMETGFHEWLHQVWNEGADTGHAMIVPRSKYMVRAMLHRYAVRNASRWRTIVRWTNQHARDAGYSTGFVTVD